jgi:RNA polymerase-binding transcription factor DksA
MGGYKGTQLERSEGQKRHTLELIAIADAAKKARRVFRQCECCGKSVSMPPSVANRGWRFCSLKCRYEFMRGASGANAGGGQWMLGTGNPRYKDGTGYERSERKHEEKVNQWRRRVFARDHYTCQLCGYTPGRPNSLNAHHIKLWSEYPDERFNVANGITLCVECHKELHRKQREAKS